MRGLTVQQPWAWAIAEGHKTVENRTWSTPYRGRLVIHAGKTWDPAGAEAVPTLLPPGVLTPGHWRTTLPLGAVVAVVDLVDICNRLAGCRCGRWAMPGQFHWRFDNARRVLPPRSVGGRLGLWPLPAALAAELINELEPAAAGGTDTP